MSRALFLFARLNRQLSACGPKCRGQEKGGGGGGIISCLKLGVLLNTSGTPAKHKKNLNSQNLPNPYNSIKHGRGRPEEMPPEGGGGGGTAENNPSPKAGTRYLGGCGGAEPPRPISHVFESF